MTKKIEIPDDLLMDLYIDQKYSSDVISIILGISKPTVCRNLKRLGITRPLSGPNSRNRNFHIKQYRNGYPVTFLPSHPRANFIGYVFDHILVMEKTIGRCPKKSEPIHHKDFDRNNCAEENLFLFSSNSEHLKGHRSLLTVAQKLYKEGIIKFIDGAYLLK